MKPRYFFFAATSIILVLNSCEALNYTDDAPVATAPQQATEKLPAMQNTLTQLPPAANRRGDGNYQHRPTNTFMQPDVFGMPSSNDLKETATSTGGSSSRQGLSVPNR